MSRYIIATFGLMPEQIEALKAEAGKRKWAYRALQEVADRFAPYLAEKFVVAALRRAGREVAVRSTAKWVPVVGTLISAGVGYQLATRYGMKLIDECEVAAREISASLEGRAEFLPRDVIPVRDSHPESS